MWVTWVWQSGLPQWQAPALTSILLLHSQLRVRFAQVIKDLQQERDLLEDEVNRLRADATEHPACQEAGIQVCSAPRCSYHRCYSRRSLIVDDI